MPIHAASDYYDLDSFRDPGIHWLYLSEAINDPKYKGTTEPDPFAAELLTEGAAQMGVLILRSPTLAKR